MEFGLAFSYIFKDPDWVKKVLLIAVIMLIPVIGQLVGLGFAMQIMKNVIDRDPTPLPELDFGGFLGKGFKAAIISLVYAIPFIIFLILMLAPFLAESNGGDVVMYISYAVSCICGGLGFIYMILMFLLMPAAYGEFLVNDSIGAALKFGTVFGLVKKAPVAFLLAILALIITTIIAPLGLIACFVGVLATGAYSLTIMGHMFGQAYNQAVSAG